jgi:hypothetical protein
MRVVLVPELVATVQLEHLLGSRLITAREIRDREKSHMRNDETVETPLRRLSVIEFEALGPGRSRDAC